MNRIIEQLHRMIESSNHQSSSKVVLKKKILHVVFGSKYIYIKSTDQIGGFHSSQKAFLYLYCEHIVRLNCLVLRTYLYFKLRTNILVDTYLQLFATFWLDWPGDSLDLRYGRLPRLDSLANRGTDTTGSRPTYMYPPCEVKSGLDHWTKTKLDSSLSFT